MVGCLGAAQGAAAQSPDSKFIKNVDELLSKTRVAMLHSAYDLALEYAQSAMREAKEIAYQRGEVQAYDALAELMLQMGRSADMNEYDAQLVPLAQYLRDTSFWANGLNRQGIYLMENGRPKVAEQRFLEALNLGLEKRQTPKTAEIYSNLGSNNLAVGNNEKAMEWFFKALRLYEKHQQLKGMGETFSNISSVFYLMRNIDDAIQFQRKSIEVRKAINDEAGLVITHVNIGQLYILKNDFPLALSHLQQAVYHADNLNNANLQASAYAGMGTYYSRNNVLDTALQWHARAIRIFEDLNNKTQLSRLYVSTGSLAHRTGDSLQATKYFHKALDLALSLKNKENIANANLHLSRFYEDHHDMATAFSYYKVHRNYRDSIATQSAMAAIEEVRTEYETEKKEAQIAQLTSGQQIKQLQIEKQNALLAGNLLEARQNELRIKQQEEALERQTLIAQNTAQQLQLNKQEKELQNRQLKNSRNLRNAILAGMLILVVIGYFLFNRYQLKRTIRNQQHLLDIRNHIAKDLHDEIGSTLTSIKILSDVSGKKLKDDQGKISTYLQQIATQSALAQQGMSDIVWAVKPDNDKLESMQIRMREYVAQTLEPTAITVKWLLDARSANITLNMERRRDFLLIFKEAINNVAKHARASEVIIRLLHKPHHVVLSVEDNGQGFDINGRRTSSGLANMRKRAQTLGGKLDIDTGSQGTSIKLILPLEQQ
ncbi:hypothetical protein GCM10007415_13250 [Parapedobacter pyrenivorans]|uniref:histidine kinase n=1 Tax=Parapedobacter pyrenivorans TaxID=1305674 RepID=A0A917HK97_9SPHI|nr:tetratricopeptide repeat protein [Parapedobacter pyrenivorans]GGG81867.1 hypothetical protein GCM10007415_13250 [Parapedobacter pyrenivorans]